jgi:hypothetical protein
MHSDIHVAVRFHDQSVFAGELLQCTITFRNVANLAEEPLTPSLQSHRRSRRESISQLAAQANRPNNVLRLSQHGRSYNNEHPPGQASHRRPSPSANNRDTISNARPQRPVHKQQRSISIISVASPTVAGDVGSLTAGGWDKQKRPGHSRSSTVQIQHGESDRNSIRVVNQLIICSVATSS